MQPQNPNFQLQMGAPTPWQPNMTMPTNLQPNMQMARAQQMQMPQPPMPNFPLQQPAYTGAGAFGPAGVFNSDNANTSPLIGGQSTPQAMLPAAPTMPQMPTSPNAPQNYGPAMQSAYNNTKVFGMPPQAPKVTPNRDPHAPQNYGPAMNNAYKNTKTFGADPALQPVKRNPQDRMDRFNHNPNQERSAPQPNGKRVFDRKGVQQGFGGNIGFFKQ